MPLERNLLAEYFSRLATLAFERGQWDIATDYMRLVNEVTYEDNRGISLHQKWCNSVAGSTR